jgi:uncharacterized protein with GYD domain
MPLYLHQWTYKDERMHSIIVESRNRADIVRIAIEAFGGKLREFYMCFGEYDGVAITEFPNDLTALACIMSIFGQGGLNSVKTTVLIPSDVAQQAMELAQKMVDPGAAPGSAG